MSDWPMVPLGEVLRKSDDWIQLHADKTYREVTVRLWGKGATLRREVLGAEIAAASRLRVHAHQFIISRIDARNGASGLIPLDLEGAVVSNDFPVFTPVPEKLDPRFLGWLSQTKSFVALCRAASEGTTNRVRLKEDRFLATTIALPPLVNQRRLVARIETLAAKIEEAKRLQQEVISGQDDLCRSILRSGPVGSLEIVPMTDLVRLREPNVAVKSDESYHFAGVFCFGRGVFVGQRKTGMEFQYKKLTRLRTDDFVYPKLMAWEGALSTVPPECDGLVVSTEYPVFEINRDRVLPEVLDVFFRTPSVWPELSGASTGTNVRRRRLNPADFLRFQFPLPTMATQLKLREVKKRIETIRKEREASARELAALFPAILDRAFNGQLCNEK